MTDQHEDSTPTSGGGAGEDNQGPTRLQADPPAQAETAMDPPGQAASSGGDSRDSLFQDMTIGPYRLVKRLGEGGMGEVWQAEQERPVRRTVALKVIKQGMDTREIVARFESERQALAMMEHPCIARVFDAGATERGLPYFVMEYVDGVPISRWCDENRLDLRARLELFNQVCAGVQHAHQKTIMHRDLKPSNVLVTTVDGKAVPKIIDFGIAKATGQQLSEDTVYTQIGQVMGTPEYMSPEQADPSSQNIDTRTDVYSLGVILYELMTGALPFDRRDMLQVGLVGLLRSIREVEPLRPSVKVTALGEKGVKLAERRSTEPASLRRELRGDLDWIVMKAMEKDRARRYDSPSELASDITRYLGDEPIVARPPSTAYRVSKFVRRNSVGVTAAAILLVLLVGFAVSMTVQANRIARERDRANREAEESKRVSKFLIDLFKVSDPSEARGNNIRAREILDKGAGDIRKTLTDQPEVQARLMNTMGEVYRNLGLYAPSEPLLKGALETRRRVLGEDNPETLVAMRELGILYYYLGKYDECEKLFRDSLEKRRRVLGPNDPATLESMNGLANLYNRLGRYGEAEPLYVEALAAQRRLLPKDHADTLKTVNNLSSMYKVMGRWWQAEPLAVEALEARRRTLGADHPATLNALGNLASIYQFEGQYDKAEPLFVQALETRRRVLGDEHPETLLQMNNLGDLYTLEGKFDLAEPLLLKALETQKRTLGAEHADTLLLADTLGDLYMAEKKYDLATPLHLSTYEGRKKVLGPTHEDTLHSLASLVAVHVASGDSKGAGTYLDLLISIRREQADASNAEAEAKDAYARLLLTCDPADRRDSATAMKYILAAEQMAGNDDPELLDTLSLVYYRRGDTAKAVDHEKRALSVLPPGKSELRVRMESALAEYERSSAPTR